MNFCVKIRFTLCNEKVESVFTTKCPGYGIISLATMGLWWNAIFLMILLDLCVLGVGFLVWKWGWFRLGVLICL